VIVVLIEAMRVFRKYKEPSPMRNSAL